MEYATGVKTIIEPDWRIQGLEYLTVSLAARKTKTSVRTIYGWIYSGKLRAFRIHSKRGIRIAEPDLDECIKRFELHPNSRVLRLIDLKEVKPDTDYDQKVIRSARKPLRGGF